MSDLVLRFIDEEKADWLVKALLDVIENDKQTNGKTFNIENRPIEKTELLSINSVNLAAFVLGIWHYIVTNVSDNTVGDATFKKWHVKKGEANSEWIFRSDIGNSVKRKLTVLSFADFSFQTNLNEPSNFVEEETDSQEEPFAQEKTADNASAVTNQVVINGNVYNQHGDNSKQYFGNIGILID